MGFFQSVVNRFEKKKLEGRFEKDPSPELVVELSDVYEGNEGVETALKFVKKAIKQFPKSKELANKYKELVIRDRNRQKEELQKKILQNPSPIIYSRLATIHFEENELAKAEELCTQTIKEYPDYGGVYQILGDVQLEKGAKKEALTCYEKALDMNKNNFQALKKLSQIYMESGQVNKAVGNLKHALQFNPGDTVIEEMLKRAEEGIANPTIRIDTVGEDEDVIEESVEAQEAEDDEVTPEQLNMILTVKDESGKVRIVPVAKEAFHIGRAANNDLMLDDKKHIVSRDHARFEFNSGMFAILDNESGNGTFLNGKRIKRAIVKNNDLLEIGNFSITINIGESMDPERTMIGGTPNDFDKTMISPPSSGSMEPASEEKSSLQTALSAIIKIHGVKDALLVNASGFVIAAELSENSSEDALGAAVARLGKTLADGSLIEKINKVTATVIDCDDMSIFLKVQSQFTLAVFAAPDCKRGLLEFEMDKVFAKI